MSLSFSALGLPDAIVDVLARNDIDSPFPIQAEAIPAILEGRDVAGRAPTGSGKTLAFGLPILATVPVAKSKRPTALILSPTRELAGQIRKDLAPYAKATGRQAFAIYGGVRYQAQFDWLNRGVDVLVATPGRLEDLIDQGAVSLSDVQIVAVDEADRMADMGFLPSVKKLLDQTSPNRQTLLFSATLDGDVKVLVRRYQNDPVTVEAGDVETDALDAEHLFWAVDQNDKLERTAEIIDATGNSIVFTKTRHGADRVARQLAKMDVKAIALHGGRSQNQRNRALAQFKNGEVDALVATDVAARGIHVDGVSSVVHFDPPHGHKDYLHRSGRTARAGSTGVVISLITKGQRRAAIRMQRNLELDLPIEEPRVHRLYGMALATDNGHRTSDTGRRTSDTGQRISDNGRKSPEPRSQNPKPKAQKKNTKRQGELQSNSDLTAGEARSDTGHRTTETAQPKAGDRHQTADDRRRAKRSGKKRAKQQRSMESRSNSNLPVGEAASAPVVSGSGELVVGNLPWKTTDADLKKLFAKHGRITSAKVKFDRRGRSKGVGIVVLNPTEAQKAAKVMHGRRVGGREITVRVGTKS